MKIIPARFKKFFARKDSATDEARLINPERDWRFLLAGLAATLALSAALHGLLYLKLDVSSEHYDHNLSPGKLLRKAELTRLVSEYRAKEDNLNNLLENRPTILDPAK